MARFQACWIVLALISSNIPTVSSFLPSSKLPLGLSEQTSLARATLPIRGPRLARGVCIGGMGVGRFVASANAAGTAGETLTPGAAVIDLTPGEAFTIERRRMHALRRQVNPSVQFCSRRVHRF